jgi:hypothetical protein
VCHVDIKCDLHLQYDSTTTIVQFTYKAFNTFIIAHNNNNMFWLSSGKEFVMRRHLLRVPWLSLKI